MKGLRWINLMGSDLGARVFHGGTEGTERGRGGGRKECKMKNANCKMQNGSSRLRFPLTRLRQLSSLKPQLSAA